MRFRLVHGWGFDAHIWDGFDLPNAGADDRGYFGDKRSSVGEEGPVIAVGHSLGALLLLRGLPADCAGLVAINGFDRFAGDGGDDTAVPRRVVERMIARFREQSEQVLGDFRRRCGSDDPLPVGLRAERLLADLALLRDADERAVAGRLSIPLLVLHGGEDAILPPAMREAGFADCANVECHELPGHGHLLPLTAPLWCADRIRAFAARIAIS